MNKEQKDIMDMTLDELAAFRIEQIVKRQTEEQREMEVQGFLKKQAEPKKYELQKRQSYMMDRDLLERMDAMAEEHGRGFKVWLINQALREKLDRMQG